MKHAGYAVALTAVLAGCAASPPVTGDARGPFDTVSGVYGGNEFSALSPEGQRRFAGEPAPARSEPAAAPVKAEAKAPAPVAVAAAPASAGVAVSTLEPFPSIAIDANAFAAVFGSTTSEAQPTADQLMQLDSLSLVVAEGMRVDLQHKILACRRAGVHCRLTAK